MSPDHAFLISEHVGPFFPGTPRAQLSEIELEAYNEVDCKVMMEIVRYLRANH